MSVFSNRLRAEREYCGYSQKEFAAKVNIAANTYNGYETGNRMPNLEVVSLLADSLKVSVDYLLGRTDIKNPSTVNLENEIKIDNVVKLPVLGAVRAGTGGWAVEEVVGYEYAFNIHDDTSDYYYLKVKGDSMEPHISEGDLALVRKQSDVESGELAIVLINGDEGVIKKVVKRDGRLELHSFNAYYPVRVFSGPELQDVSIIGKVVNTTRHW